MRTGRPKGDLLLTDEECSQLQSFASSRSLPADLSSRARIVLSSADGEANNAMAERLKLTKATVGMDGTTGGETPMTKPTFTRDHAAPGP